MTISFQDNLLRFLFQSKDAKQYKDDLDAALFEVNLWKQVFVFWHHYVTKYNSIPVKPAFLEFVDRELKHSPDKVSTEAYTELLNTIAVVYTPVDFEYDFTRDVIIEYAKRRGVRNLIVSKAEKIKNATEKDLDDMFGEFRRIVNIGAASSEKHKGNWLFDDPTFIEGDYAAIGHPTFLQSLNYMTSARGFYSPQLILLLGGPKASKTLILLSILIEYARSGRRVFIADAENGELSMRNRIKQILLECEMHEVPRFKKELTSIMTNLRRYGGNIYFKYFPMGSTLDDVERELEKITAEDGVPPKVIMYDYLQKFSPTNKKIFDRNLQVQHVMQHAQALNAKYDMFGFTAAKIKQSAVSKLVIKPDDIAVDFGQAYDAQAVFALCRTEDEVSNGYGRIVPVYQREGIPYSTGPQATCALKIENAVQRVTELDSKAYLDTLQEEYDNSNSKTKKPIRKYIAPSSLKDE